MLGYKIYVINLDEEHGKWQRMKEQLKGSQIPVERFSAINGKLLDEYTKKAQTTPFCYNHCTDSMIGIFLSHREIWKKALEENLDYAIVFEDDIKLDKDFRKKIDYYIQTNKNFDIMLLGCLFGCDTDNYFNSLFFDILHSIDTISSGKIERVEKKYSNKDNVCRRVNYFTGAHAYIVSKRGLEKLINLLNKASFHVDISMSNHNLHIIKAPTIANQNNFEESNNVNYSNYDNYLNKIKIFDLPLGWLLNMPLMRLGQVPINMKLILVILLFYLGVNQVFDAL